MAQFEAGKCQTPALYLIRLNYWKESVSCPNMDQAGPLPHNTARIDSFSGCRLHDLQPGLVAKMAKKWLSQQQCMPLGNAARPSHAHIIQRVSIQKPTVTPSLITMCFIHGRDWNSQSYGLKLRNSAHCSRTSQSFGTINVGDAPFVISYWRGSGGLSTHASIVGQLHFARMLRQRKAPRAPIGAHPPTKG